MRISLDILRSFDVAARHLSFTMAAQELGVTQGAVSQRIKSLETELGCALFHRETRAIRLTPAGVTLHQAVAKGIRTISEGLAAVTVKAGTPLRLAVSASIANRWLVPRLSRLGELSPKITVSVLADDRLNEIGVEADLALRFSPGRHSGLTRRKLGGETLYPVCSPEFLTAYPAAGRYGSAEWSALPRLIDDGSERDGSGCGWKDWSRQFAISFAAGSPTVGYSHAYLAIAGAEQGLGMAMARHLLVMDAIAAGRLVRLGPPDAALVPRYSYFAVTAGEPDSRLRTLIAWLKRQMGGAP